MTVDALTVLDVLAQERDEPTWQSLTHVWDAYAEERAAGCSPFAAGVRVAARADRLGHAFAVGYPAALEHLFQGPTVLPCADARDANDDGAIDLADVIGLLDRLFAGAAPLPAPSDRSTGPDPTPDALGCG